MLPSSLFKSFRPLCLVVLAGAFFPDVSGATYTVNSLAELQVRLRSAVAGDVISVTNGAYVTDAAINLDCRGDAGAPITLKAERVGGVEIGGTHGFIVKGSAAHVTIAGFVFTHAAGRSAIEVGARHVRFTRNTFQCSGPGAYLTIGGDDVQVDRNDFRDKKTLGNMIDVRGANAQVGRRVWIHHNYFHDFAPAGGNGAETIRFGLSGLSMSMGHGLVEHNLFVRCLGENELISNKSGGNTYRYNTFLDSPGTQLTLRHGNECAVYGNYFRNTDGLRVFGDRHQIYGNYFEGNSLGINLGNGGAEVAEGAPLTSHDRPDDNLIAYNILIDNAVHYGMNARTPKALGATNTVFAYNIIQGGGVAARIAGPNAGAVWSGNLLWNTAGAGDLPDSGYIMADPRLVRDHDGVYRRTVNSPAIDASVPVYSARDYYKDSRGRVDLSTSAKDADQGLVKPVPVRRLSEHEVGPQSGRAGETL